MFTPDGVILVLQHILDDCEIAEIQIEDEFAEVQIVSKKLMNHDSLQIITNASEYTGRIKKIRLRNQDGIVLMERALALDKTNQFGIVNAFTVQIKTESLADGEFFEVISQIETMED